MYLVAESPIYQIKVNIRATLTVFRVFYFHCVMSLQFDYISEFTVISIEQTAMHTVVIKLTMVPLSREIFSDKVIAYNFN